MASSLHMEATVETRLLALQYFFSAPIAFHFVSLRPTSLLSSFFSAHIPFLVVSLPPFWHRNPLFVLFSLLIVSVKRHSCLTADSTWKTAYSTWKTGLPKFDYKSGLKSTDAPCLSSHRSQVF